MDNLQRQLAPVSDMAWAQIEQEASRTLKHYLGARRVVDVIGPLGKDVASVSTGHIHPIDAPDTEASIGAAIREVYPLVELRIPFELSRQAIDDVERGSEDSDWSPLKEAAQKIAFAEDRAIFEGYTAAGIEGIRKGSSNKALTLPADIKSYPGIVEKAVNELRLAGVNGPYILVLGTGIYGAISSASDDGYPVLKHIQTIVDENIVWVPSIAGGFVLSTRGGDFALSIGQDISIGYLSHTDTTVKLYFQESFTFRVLTSEAVVSLENTL